MSCNLIGRLLLIGIIQYSMWQPFPMIGRQFWPSSRLAEWKHVRPTIFLETWNFYLHFNRKKFTEMDFSTWYYSVPTFTRLWFSGTIVVTLLGKLNILPVQYLFLSSSFVFKNLQVCIFLSSLQEITKPTLPFSYGDRWHPCSFTHPASTSW